MVRVCKIVFQIPVYDTSLIVFLLLLVCCFSLAVVFVVVGFVFCGCLVVFF